MRQSQLFTKTTKTVPKDEVSLNAKLLIQAGFVDKLMAGVYIILPLGFRVFKKIENIIRQEMDLVGGQEMFMPSLHPKANWDKTGRWQNMDDLFKFKSYYSKIDVALGPTHEEVLSPTAKKYIASYKDLPFAAYHIQNKFRDEKRAKSGVLRGREFMMKDLYSFHADQKDLDKYYEQVKKAYFKIFNRCGIGKKTYLTYASGGTFSKYSHEFQTLTEAGEDIIYICDKCRAAVNKEIMADQKNSCPECGNKDLREAKAVEVGNIFKLGTKFSKPFGLTYKDKTGKDQLVIMGCYGIGLQRLMGTIVEIMSDKNGIIWPEAVAPFKVHLISLRQNKKADKIYKDLEKAGVEVLYDDREDVSPGAKFADADLIGCPYRLVVSEKTLAEDSVEVKLRDSDKIDLVKLGDIVDKIFKL
ncbi:prolyl-tRNA synthetase [Candidatus Falkowbacteria bacterium CG11_big_fil_rev_8_21_14_0_20_39_10]|uniref:Proline--tRNA ligase n=1 Tax=Candidatus Falkowbacteria bacterium CG11_big_fil_rev_8_21_14_0_20_39_10 TaxID=1974570 RepID=A0A2M6K938_9BACT|nr:MAG: prolyl-tRNA synthetase [Candidatus Falkowbacteria bacterium CG11_big_fil_rev_8_21_14_0_20_39_10]